MNIQLLHHLPTGDKAIVFKFKKPGRWFHIMIDVLLITAGIALIVAGILIAI